MLPSFSVIVAAAVLALVSVPQVQPDVPMKLTPLVPIVKVPDTESREFML